MDKHSFFIALWVLCFIPVSLFSRSRVVNDTIFSKKLNTERTCSVYLPPSYGEVPGKKYPVLYLFHGMSQTNQDWVWRRDLDDGDREAEHQPDCRRCKGQQQGVAEALQHIAHQLPAAENFDDVLKKHTNNSL